MNEQVEQLDTNPNGQAPETIELPIALVQQIVDYLMRCPAGDVYPILRTLEQLRANE